MAIASPGRPAPVVTQILISNQRFARATVGVPALNAAGSAAVYGIGQSFSGQTFGVQGYNFANTRFCRRCFWCC